MSSPTPHKSDSGKRRSALSAAFEELALRPHHRERRNGTPHARNPSRVRPPLPTKIHHVERRNFRVKQDWSPIPNIPTNAAI
jgi:hypothetical protein